MSNEDLLGKIEGAQSAEAAAIPQLIAGAPSTSPPPVDLNEPATEVPTGAVSPSEPIPAPAYVAPGYNPELAAVTGIPNWKACTGQDIQAMLKAHAAGFQRTPGFTREDVYAFLASKGQ